MLIDAHVHVWDGARLSYPWLATVPGLAARYDDADYRAAIVEAPQPDAWIFVQAECEPMQALDEVRWVSGLASPPAAIVAHAPVHDARALETALAAYLTQPLVRGIRHNVQGEASGFASGAAMIAGVRRVGEAGYPFDLCCTHDQLDEVIALVAAAPATRFVLDHCGKPPVRAGSLLEWRSALARLAMLPNVVCKLSGLATEADADWTPRSIQPWLEAALVTFTPERCLFGSDWPVLELAGRWSQWHEAVARVVDHLAPAEQDAVWWRTAAVTYRVALPAGAGA